MLEPADRRVLLDALRPPEGYRVDRALATTYTLDLLALLTAPLAFSLYDALVEKEGEQYLDGLPLLQAVRDHASRLSVFCQTGGISAPRRYRPLLGYLEESVVQVSVPGGIFHPKIWVLRFMGGAEDATLYRLLVSTRNLTFDRTWDTLLVLDGVLKDRKNAITSSRPVAEFVAALPGLGSNVPERVRRDVALLAEELPRVDWVVPEPFESLVFWPLGHDGKKRSPVADERHDRSLVVSPFLTKDLLQEIASSGADHILVSRQEELERLGTNALAGYAPHVLQEGVDGDEEESADEVVIVPQRPPPRGLHAKLFVLDAGWKAHVFTGSANATSPAFANNVEFLVQLTGKKSKVGIAALLDEDDKGGLRSLLQPFTPGPARGLDPQEALERALEPCVAFLAALPWSAHARREGTDAFDVELSAQGFRLFDDLSVVVWPITLSEDRAYTLAAGSPARFKGCSAEALTPFFAFRACLARGGLEATSTFVVRVPGNFNELGIDRAALLLRSMLGDSAKLVRLLRLLLAIDGVDRLSELAELVRDGETTETPSAQQQEQPLFEALVRALDREPHKLEAVQRLVEEVGKMENGQALLPPGFHDIWGPVREAWHKRTGGAQP